MLDYPAPRDADGRLAFVWEYAWSWVMAAVLMWRAWLLRPFALIQISGMPDVYAPLAVPFRWMGAVIVLEEGQLPCGIGAELAFAVREAVPHARVNRIGARRAPISSNPVFEAYCVPDAQRVRAVAEEWLSAR